MLFDDYVEVDGYVLKRMVQFAGMSIKEIREWLIHANYNDHMRWIKEYSEKRAKEKAEDEKYCETDKNVIDPKTSVQSEECVRIAAAFVDKDGFVSKQDLSISEPFVKLSVGDKRVYVSKDLIARALRVRKQRSIWG